MSGIDEVLKLHIFLRAPFAAALVAEVDGGKVHGVVAVEVGSGAVLDHGRNPYGSESECLDVVEFLNQTGEVASPVGVIVCNLHGLVVPAADVVPGIRM